MLHRAPGGGFGTCDRSRRDPPRIGDTGRSLDGDQARESPCCHALRQSSHAGVAALAARRARRLTDLLASAARRSPLYRRLLRCPVTNSYGASEFLSLASECVHGHLHLNSDWVILESVDDQGREVPSGEAGVTTLLANLASHVQPLIRYDLGDRARRHAGVCSCGSHLPVIDVQGRCDDTLRLGRPQGRFVSVLPLALSTVLEDDAGLFDFQLVQQGPCELLLRVECAEIAAFEAASLNSIFRRRLAVPCRLEA